MSVIKSGLQMRVYDCNTKAIGVAINVSLYIISTGDSVTIPPL